MKREVNLEQWISDYEKEEEAADPHYSIYYTPEHEDPGELSTNPKENP